MAKQIKLSVCMMVKNEEKNLRRCLESFMSIKGWCDQLIVIDTGCEDSTMEIAKEFGAECYVYPHKEWDFSKGRNISISKAKGDWLFIVDADEELCGPPQEFRKIKKHLSKIKDIHAVSIRAIDIIKNQPPMNQSLMRFFRRGKVQYIDTVHTRPVVEGGNRTLSYAGDLHIKHYGYDLAPEEMQAKYRRTIGLLKKRLEKDPEDILSYFYLAQIYGFYNDEENCLKCCKIYLREVARKKLKREDVNESIYSLAINLFIKRKEFDDAAKYLNYALSVMPRDLDISYAQIQYGIATEDHASIMNGIFNFIRNYECFNKEDWIKERGSRFTFSYNQHHIGMVMYYASHFFLTYGMNCLHSFDHILTQTDSLLEEEKGLKESLLNIGIDWKRLTKQKGE